MWMKKDTRGLLIHYSSFVASRENTDSEKLVKMMVVQMHLSHVKMPRHFFNSTEMKKK